MKSAALAFALLSLTACANNKDSGEDLTRSDTGTGLLGEIGPGLDASTDTKLDPDSACGATTEKATLTPVNLYVMFDKSQSMGPLTTSTKWAGARKGMEAFVKDPTSAGLRIAIKFFPLKVEPTPACSSTAYATPVVPFDVLPKNADPILAAIDAETPDGFTTPMYPALLGAINGTITEVKARPGEAGAVLLITDGAPDSPTTCGTLDPTDPKVLAGAAATGLAFTPSVKTFVIGLPGANLGVVNQIAAAGGSTSAILVTDSSKIEEQFRDALAAVRGKAVPCEIGLPDKVTKGEVSYGLVNVTYTKGGAPPPEDLLQDPTCASGAGWRYDDASKPTKIILCPKTCDEVHADPKAQIDILLGCATRIK
ncbi:MAG: vWA domain-containing protein [Polyangiales bacterium]